MNRETGGRVVAVNMSNPNELYAGMYKGFRKGWDIISGGPATEGRHLQINRRRRDTWTKLSNGLPQPLIGKIDIDIARSAHHRLRDDRGAGEQGGLYRSDDAAATWRLVNNAGNLRSRPFYFNYVDVNPKNPDEVWVNALSLHKSTNGGKSFSTVSTPHGDNMGIWFNPDDPPETFIQSNDGGANVTRDGGRTWSSILNQPTGEFYMVSVDQQHPYLLYGPQQDNSTVVLPSTPTVSFGFDHPAQAWTQASGCETGGIMPTPDGKVIWGACKGELERFSVETGQSQGRWIYPQNRYGHHPTDISTAFQGRPLFLSRSTIQRPSTRPRTSLHRTSDDGVTWQIISPDLTWNDPKYQIVPGNPITRDVTGEEVYSSIYSMAESPRDRNVLWVGANDGPVHVTRDGGKTWKNVTPKDLPPGGRVQNIDASAARAGTAYIAVYRYLFEHDLKPYIYRTDDYGATWSKLTDGTNGIPVRPSNARRARGPGAAGPALRRHRVRFLRLVRQWRQVALTAAEPSRNAGHRPPRPSRRPGYFDDGSGVLDHGRRFAVAAAGNAAGLVDLRRAPDRCSSASEPSSPIARPGGRRGGAPEYPAVAQPIDYLLPAGFKGALSLEITDAGGRVVRTVTRRQWPAGQAGGQGGGGQAGAGDPDDPDMRGGRGRGGPAAALTTKPGHNRFLWDYRWANNGPLAAPGRYRVRLAVGEGAGRGDVQAQPTQLSRSFEVKVDPGVIKDGTTVADLVDQQNFLLGLRAAMNDAAAMRVRLQQAMQKAGVQPAPSPGPGESTTQLVERLQQCGYPRGDGCRRYGRGS